MPPGYVSSHSIMPCGSRMLDVLTYLHALACLLSVAAALGNERSGSRRGFCVLTHRAPRIPCRPRPSWAPALSPKLAAGTSPDAYTPRVSLACWRGVAHVKRAAATRRIARNVTQRSVPRRGDVVSVNAGYWMRVGWWSRMQYCSHVHVAFPHLRSMRP